MIRAAIIGCGMVADQHLSQIGRVSGSRIVAVCDREPLMARQLADRFKVASFFADAKEMIESAKPNVVHITTPAQSHFALGKMCLEAGCHIYMEKPFTITAAEAEEIITIAESKGLKVTAGHNLQFNPEAIRMREMVKAGFLGGPPIHMECMQSFTHSEPTYGAAVLGDRSHWVRSLPGSLLQNLISHGLAKIAEFLPNSRPRVVARVFSSPYLRSLGQDDLVDEVRAVIYDRDVTANFTFSTQLATACNQLRLYGRKASLIADSTNRMLIPIQQTGYKSYLRYFLTPFVYAKAYRRNSWRNIKQFLMSDFHEDYSMRLLVKSFYLSIQGKASVPLPYNQILATARIMDDIFAQIPRSPSRDST